MLWERRRQHWLDACPGRCGAGRHDPNAAHGIPQEPLIKLIKLLAGVCRSRRSGRRSWLHWWGRWAWRQRWLAIQPRPRGVDDLLLQPPGAHGALGRRLCRRAIARIPFGKMQQRRSGRSHQAQLLRSAPVVLVPGLMAGNDHRLHASILQAVSGNGQHNRIARDGRLPSNGNMVKSRRQKCL